MKPEPRHKMPEENDDGAYGYRNNLSFRISQAERICREHEHFLDELRLARAGQDGINKLRDEQIKNLKEDVVANLKQSTSDLSKEIKDMDVWREKFTASFNQYKMDSEASWRKTLAKLATAVEDNKVEITNQFDQFQISNKTWIIGILVSIVLSTIVIIFSRVVTIPGGHV